MKISIEGYEYEVTDECIAGLLSAIRGVLISSNIVLPIDIQIALTEVNSLTDDSLLRLIQAIKDFGLKYYYNLSTPKRLGVMATVRAGITQIEKKAGNSEAARQLRPPKKADPIEHLVSVFYPIIEKTIPISAALTENLRNIIH